MPKMKPTKGVLKRARITGTGKVRFSRTGKQKLNGHERGSVLQDRRGYVYITKPDLKRCELLLKRRLTPA